MFEWLKGKSLAEPVIGDSLNPIARQESVDGPKKVDLLVTQEIGSSGTELYGGYFSEEYLPELSGVEAAVVYDKMRRNDARIKMALSAVLNPIKGASWEVSSGGDSDAEKVHAEFISHIFFNGGLGPEKTWKDFLGEVLTFVAFGHSVFEVTDSVVFDSKKFGTYNGIKNLGFRAQNTLRRWNLDKQSGLLLSVEQNAYGDLERNVLIPGDKLLTFSLDKEGDNYEGISALRPAYGSWLRKQFFLKMMAIGIERNAVPTPIVKYKAGQENSAQWAAMIRNIRGYTSHQRNYFAHSADYEVDFTTNTFSSKDVKDAIEFENVEMTVNFLANFLLLGQSGASGSYSLSFDLSDFFLGGLEHLAEYICDRINMRLIPRLVRMKYGPQENYPKLTATGISDKAGKELAEVLKMLRDGNYIVPTDDDEVSIRKRFGLPKMSENGKRPLPGTGTISQPGSDQNPTDEDEKENPEEPGDDEPEDDDPDSKGQPKKLSEKKNSFQLAEPGKPKRLIAAARDRLVPYMREDLQAIADRLVQDLVKSFKASAPSQRINSYKGVAPVGGVKYQLNLVDWLAEVATLALEDVRKEVPKAKGVKLSEGFQFDEFSRLPKKVQRRIKAQSQLIVDSQLADLSKAVFFKFSSNVENVLGSADLLEKELQDAADDYVEGAAIGTGAANASAVVVNESRNAFFFDDEVLDEVESFTFVNGDPVTDICKDLAGRTFAKDDAEAERYFPPLHHNCKSFITVNLKGSNKKLSPEGLEPSSAALKKSIKFDESFGKHLDME